MPLNRHCLLAIIFILITPLDLFLYIQKFLLDTILYFIRVLKVEANELALSVKTLVAKPDDLTCVLQMRMVGGENCLCVVLLPPYKHYGMCLCIHTYTNTHIHTDTYKQKKKLCRITNVPQLLIMFFSLVNFSFVHCDFHLFKTLLVVLATEIHTLIGFTDP